MSHAKPTVIPVLESRFFLYTRLLPTERVKKQQKIKPFHTRKRLNKRCVHRVVCGQRRRRIYQFMASRDARDSGHLPHACTAYDGLSSQAGACGEPRNGPALLVNEAVRITVQRCFGRAVAQKLAYGFHIHAHFKKPRGVTVPQRMKMHA